MKTQSQAFNFQTMENSFPLQVLTKQRKFGTFFLENYSSLSQNTPIQLTSAHFPTITSNFSPAAMIEKLKYEV
jgi:hypothetical protein